MLRKASEVVSEGNGPVHQEEIGFGQPAPVDEFRGIRGRFSKLKELMRRFEQYLLSQGADTKTRERTEGAVTAVQAVRGDGFSARRVEPGPNTNSTSFGVKVKPPALPCRDDVVVECGDAASESCLPSLEMRSPTAGAGLVPTGEASTATETNVNQPPLRFCSTEKTDLEAKNSWTSVPSASYDGSSVFQERNLSATLYCRRVVDTKSRQKRTFDPGGSRGHLRACPFLGSWRALVCGEVIRPGAAGEEFRWLVVTRPVLMPCQTKVLPSRAARGFMNWREERRSRSHSESR